MTTLSHLIDTLIERAHSGNTPLGISPTSCSQVLGLGAVHEQVCHGDPTDVNTNPVNRVIDSTLGGLAGDYLHEEIFAQPQQQAKFLLHLIPLILKWIKQQGGLSAALNLLEEKGLEAQLKSWVGSGVNDRIMPEQLNDVFEQDSLNELAKKYRINVDTVRTGLATVLPQVISHLTTEEYTSGLDSADVEINNILNRLVNI